MENILIIYKSKYGAAREYAQLLGKALDTAPVSVDQAKSQMVTSADTIILCGGIYASSIAGLSFLKKNTALLSGKKTAVFAVGASPYDQKTLEELKKRHLSGALEGIPLFYGRGAWNEEIMTVKDKFLCSMLMKVVSKKPAEQCEPWELALKEAMGKKCSWVDEKFLEPLYKYIHKDTR